MANNTAFDAIFDAIIVGGGLHGLSAALHLARAGLKPLVLEKGLSGSPCLRSERRWRAASGSSIIAEVPLSVAAHGAVASISRNLVDDDCGFSACGQIKIAENETELATTTAERDRGVTAGSASTMNN